MLLNCQCQLTSVLYGTRSPSNVSITSILLYLKKVIDKIYYCYYVFNVDDSQKIVSASSTRRCKEKN